MSSQLFVVALLPLSLSCWSFSVSAQSEICRDIPITTATGQADAPSVVVRCTRTGGDAVIGRATMMSEPGEEPEMQRVLIPGYQSGDGEEHIYVLTSFGDSGVGNTNLYPDESGAALTSMRSMRSEDGQPVESALIISSVAVDSGEMRFSMDLDDVQVEAFVNALVNARMNLEGDMAALLGQPRKRPYADGLPPRNDLVLGDRRISLAGEGLSLDETLDLLYRVSGCSVFQEGNFLVAKSCR